ncbi:hypothetical protein POVWA1_044910 [Plasmodium ovale wallikeri]|uniref:Uncharacterized protein n=1 Tax=Plasmodium ovale wallikeri TaxID=864142 RepID=A0A1A8ZDD7_PLAOA|nr:hypothetical protein POVWA1_044910 [Plasmodium ovale wallikeri]
MWMVKMGILPWQVGGFYGKKKNSEPGGGVIFAPHIRDHIDNAAAVKIDTSKYVGNNLPSGKGGGETKKRVSFSGKWH